MPKIISSLSPARPYVEAIALSAVLIFAVLLFIGFGGSEILPVQNIQWMKGGDPQQHLLGWLFYRNTDLLQWPLGANLGFGEMMAGSVVYSDSLPLFAVLFRFLDPILPEPFQYFGLWILTCFLLQGAFSYWLLRLLDLRAAAAAAGACLLVASPYMLWRLHGHEALLGHWILLASLCLYLRPRMMWLAWCALLVSAVALHAYLAVMAGGVWAARLWIERKTPLLTGLRALATFTVSAMVAWALGYFMISGPASGKEGFGIYRTTLHSWLDPDDIWGQILPDLPAGPGDGTYEGFAYLGLGALVIVILAGAGIAMQNIRKKDTAPPCCSSAQVPLSPLVMICIVFTLFALSDRISLFGVMLAEIYLPDDLPGISTFRASGRFIWLPNYVIVAFAIAWWGRLLPRAVIPILTVAAVVQVADMTQAMQHFQNRFAETRPVQLSSAFWDEAGARYDRIAAFPVDPHSKVVFEASFLAARHHMTIDQAYLARSNAGSFEQTRQATRLELATGNFRDDTLYLIHDQMETNLIGRLEANDFFAAVDGVWVLAPGWTGCRETCGAMPSKPMTLLSPELPPDGVMTLADGGNFEPFARFGWSVGETSARWTEGPLAVLSVHLGDVSKQTVHVRMTGQPFLGENVNKQDIVIVANGNTVHSVTLDSTEITTIAFDVPPNTIKDDGILDINIQISDPVSPYALGLNQDSRELGLSISTITFEVNGY